MPRIVGIHGISHQYEGPAILHSQWLPAMRDGLSAAEYRALAENLTSDDLAVAFFGDLFRPAGAVLSAGVIPYSATDLTSPEEIELLTDLYAAAVALEPALGTPVGSLGFRGNVGLMVERVLRSRTFANMVPEHVFVGSLKQVVKFLNDPGVKSRVLDRIRADVDTDTRVLVGHSLGSVVAYEYLCRYPAPSAVLVTLGSPLGIRHVVFDKLTPPPIAGAGVWPGVRRWTNIADPDDIVALRKDLALLFPPPPATAGIADVLVDNGSKTHAVQRYLTARETGSAIAAGLLDS